MKIKDVVDALEKFAPLPLQEEYDNSGLQVGLTETELSGALLCLDVSEAVIQEAVNRGCNMIISHHPLLFHPLKSVNADSYIGRCVIEAVKNGITVYSAHTNLDNADNGVNFKIAEKLGLAGISRMNANNGGSGTGIVGYLKEPMCESAFLKFISSIFAAPRINHNSLSGKKIHKVAVCGGSGASFIQDAISAKADAFVTGEIGYHHFFGVEGVILLVETGHYESEQYTVDLLHSYLTRVFPSARIEKTNMVTNPIKYYLSNN